MGYFFEGLQNYMENKNEGNKNKIILGEINCIMDEMDKDSGNKIQRLKKFKLCPGKTQCE